MDDNEGDEKIWCVLRVEERGQDNLNEGKL